MPGGRTPPKTAAAADAPPICTCQSYKGITLASRLFPWNNLLWELLKLNKYVESTWFCSGAIVTESSEIDMHLIWIHTKLWWTSSLLVEAWSKNMLCCKSANLSKQIGNTHFTSFNLWTAKTIWVVRLWQATRHTRSRSCWLQHVVMIATLPKKWWHYIVVARIGLPWLLRRQVCICVISARPKHSHIRHNYICQQLLRQGVHICLTTNTFQL
jgi:hypothetical protein